MASSQAVQQASAQVIDEDNELRNVEPSKEILAFLRNEEKRLYRLIFEDRAQFDREAIEAQAQLEAATRERDKALADLEVKKQENSEINKILEFGHKFTNPLASFETMFRLQAQKMLEFCELFQKAEKSLHDDTNIEDYNMVLKGKGQTSPKNNEGNIVSGDPKSGSSDGGEGDGESGGEDEEAAQERLKKLLMKR